ncbi:MAG: NADH-ubiquinone oxidoreductase-F iron-sulfur binding region domain-containing protein [Alphaproteobacteria bacterium]
MRASAGKPVPRKGRDARPYPKGRQVDPTALAEVRRLLGEDPRRRDLLIEYLHRLQDRYNGLSAPHLAALAMDMRLALTEVYEVATFYAHFDILREGDPDPAPLTVRVCDSLTCEIMGAGALLAGLKKAGGRGVRVVTAPCMGRCDRAPTAEVGHHHVERATVATVRAAIAAGTTDPAAPDHRSFDDYVAAGGYATLGSCYQAGDRAAVIDRLEASGLRGLGGAGFPAGRKWRLVAAQPAPRLMAVNADEGEPGTFKDRFYLETDPHRFLEGMLIAAWAVEVEEIYLYLRDEYPGLRRILVDEIARIEREGLTTGRPIHLRRGAGAYICGEESAMLESLEGKRGLPRHKPPYPAEAGLFGRPTLIHNVETVYWLRDILERGPDWFAGEGRNGRSGLRSYSVSGRVKDPGVKLAPAGITVRELIDEFCGGMAEGERLKAYLPGGASGGILPARLDDVPLDFGTLEEHGCFIGSAAVVVLSDRDNMRDVALNLMRFFAYESCGQCTPCRLGTEKAVALMERETWDVALMSELSAVMRDASICGLGQAAPNPMQSVVKYFPQDFATAPGSDS